MKITTKIHLVFIICVVSLFQVQAQQFLSREDSLALVRARDFPNIDVGKGISFMPTDSLYRLNLRFRMQNLAAFQLDENNELTSELRVKRLRLRFEGFAFSPKLSYVIQLGFSGNDNDGLPGVANMISDAIIYYIADSRFNVGFGQAKLPGNRARVNSSSALQFADRSITNAVFNLDRDFGFFGTYNKNIFKSFDIVVKTAITSGEGRNFRMSPNSGLAYTGRMEFFPLGRFKKLGDVIEGDFEREPTPKFMIATAYSYNDQSVRERGQRGMVLQNNESRDIRSFFMDFIFKYNGFAFYIDYMNRTVDDPVVFYKSEQMFADQYIYAGQGMNVQTSYIFPSNWEIACRWSFIQPVDEIKILNGYNKETQYTIGVTKYLIGHSVKIQLDQSMDHRLLPDNSAKLGWMTRFQIELGI